MVDPLTLTALLGFLAAATYFLNVLVTMNAAALAAAGAKKRRRKRRSVEVQTGSVGSALSDLFHEGKLERD